MKSMPSFVACLLGSCMAQAGEIVAWKVPLQRYSWQHSGPEDQIRLPKPPEASPFFHPGDDLWDLAKLPKEECVKTDPPLEWAVWNATTSTLVTKSDWNGIWQLHEQFGNALSPTMCRVKLEIFEVPQDASSPSDKSIPISTLTWITRSGMQTDAMTGSGDKSIQVVSGAAFGNDMLDLSPLGITVRIPGQPTFEINTAVTPRSGQRMWIARDFDGKQGLDFGITAIAELIDGSPVDDAMRLQVANESKSLVSRRREPARHRVRGNRWLFVTGFLLEDIVNLELTNESTSNANPFAEPNNTLPRAKLKLPQVEVPLELRPWIGGRAFDVCEYVRNLGMNLKEDDFAGFDPISGMIFFYSDSETEMDKFEALFTPTCILQPKVLKLTLDGPGQSMLMARSGQKATLSRTIADDKVARFLEIEPTIGENDDLIDLRLNYEDNGESLLKLNTSTTLQVDRSQSLLLGTDGKPLLRAKAEIIRP